MMIETSRSDLDRIVLDRKEAGQPFRIADIQREYESTVGRKVSMPDVIQCLQTHEPRTSA
jgi:hypothetical protein